MCRVLEVEIKSIFRNPRLKLTTGRRIDPRLSYLSCWISVGKNMQKTITTVDKSISDMHNAKHYDLPNFWKWFWTAFLQRVAIPSKRILQYVSHSIWKLNKDSFVRFIWHKKNLFWVNLLPGHCPEHQSTNRTSSANKTNIYTGTIYISCLCRLKFITMTCYNVLSMTEMLRFGAIGVWRIRWLS